MRQSTTALILIVAGVIACLLGKGRPSTGQPNSVMRPSFHEQKESTPRGKWIAWPRLSHAGIIARHSFH